MVGEAFLIGLAQIGLAFAGFSGLVGVFRRGPNEWTPPEEAGMKLVLEHTLGLMIFAALPMFAFTWFRSDYGALVFSSALLAIFFGWQFFIQQYRLRQYTTKGHKPAHPRAFKYQFLPTTLGFCFLELFNAWLGAFYLYTPALLWLMLAGVIQFLMIIVRKRESSPT